MKKKYSISMICAPKDSFDEIVEFIVLQESILHIDIIDQDFSDFEGFDINEIVKIREKYPSAIIDIHIMAQHPEKYVKFCIEQKCNLITFHIEGQQDTMALLSEINMAGLKAGLAIKPDSKVEMLYNYLDYVSLINVMTIFPGPAGQKFQKQELNKVVCLNNLKNEKAYTFDIEVDGSCNEKHFYMIEK